MTELDRAVQDFGYEVENQDGTAYILTGEDSHTTQFRKGENNDYGEDARGVALGAHAFHFADDPQGYSNSADEVVAIGIAEDGEVVETYNVDDTALMEFGLGVKSHLIDQETEEWGERLYQELDGVANDVPKLSDNLADWDSLEYGGLEGSSENAVIIDSSELDNAASWRTPLGQSSPSEHLQTSIYSDLVSEYNDRGLIDEDEVEEGMAEITNLVRNGSMEDHRSVVESQTVIETLDRMKDPRDDLLSQMDYQFNHEVENSLEV
jgi:hypothetical protein